MMLAEQLRLSRNPRRLLRAGTCLTALISISGPVMAQAVPEPSQGATPVQAATAPLQTERAQGAAPVQSAAQPGQGQLDEIIVTARYVKENLQRAPVSISTKTGDQLKAANVSNINNLGALVPNLYTHPGDADESGSPTVVMRGVIQNDASYARAPAVAIYVDDVYHASVVGSALDLTDIDHVEVNRGPQSTLSGNASIGGAIKIFTKDPTGDGSGFVTSTYGSRNFVSFTGAYDLGLADNLFVRVSGHYKRQDGYVDLLDFTCQMNKQGTPALAGSLPGVPDASAHGCKTGEEGGGTQAGARIKLRWKATDRLEINLSGNIEREDDQESPELAVKITNPHPNSSGLINVYNTAIENQFGVRYDDRFLPPAGNKYASYSTFCRPQLNGVVQQAPYQPTPSGFCYPKTRNQDSDTASARINYEIADNVHMTAIGAYSQYSNNFTQNGDESPLGYILSHFSQHVKQNTGELRFDGKLFDGKLNWVAGSFFLDYTGHSDGFIGYIADNFTEFDKAHIKSQAGFTHLDYKITDKWRISAGGRYTSGTLSYNLNHPGLIVVPQAFGAIEHRWDWLASTDYQVAPDVLAYATIASGSRPPGVTTIVITPQQLTPTPLEDMISYEAGIKSEFFDRRLRINVAGFYEDYKSLSQTEQGVQCLGELPGATWRPNAGVCAAAYPGNPSTVPWFITVGTPATIKGFEWDMVAAPTDALRLDFSGGYNKFKSGVKTLGAPGYFFPGNHLQPSWNMHASAQYKISTSFGSFTPRLDWSFQSQQDFDPSPAAEAPQPQYIIKPYSLWNAQIAFLPNNSKWSATFSVANLANKFYYYQLFSGGVVNISSVVGPPREFSFTLRRDF